MSEGWISTSRSFCIVDIFASSIYGMERAKTRHIRQSR